MTLAGAPPITLSEFLLARFADDEAAATEEAIARVSVGTVVGGPGVPAHAVDQVRTALLDARRTRPWSSLLDPARVLAECKAKRRIVAEWQQFWDSTSNDPAIGGWEGGLELAMKILALPYADHPDYREQWRP